MQRLSSTAFNGIGFNVRCIMKKMEMPITGTIQNNNEMLYSCIFPVHWAMMIPQVPPPRNALR